MTQNFNTQELVMADDLDSPEARGRRLKRIRNMANLSREQMCDDGSINIHTLSGWENGRFGGLTTTGATRVLQRVAKEGVRCSLEWLLSEIGTGPEIVADFSKIKDDLEKIVEHQPISLSEETEVIINELLLFKKHVPNVADLVITDDSMLPQFAAGDYVAGRKRFKKDIKKLIGLNCIVQTEEGKIYLRTLRIGPHENTFALTATNPYTEAEDAVLYDIKLVSAAPVIWHRKKDPK
jgi:transcriptional regulator with XRE-family HTH domain